MARITYVKAARQRYATVPVIDPETGQPKRVCLRRTYGTSSAQPAMLLGIPCRKCVRLWNQGVEDAQREHEEENGSEVTPEVSPTSGA